MWCEVFQPLDHIHIAEYPRVPGLFSSSSASVFSYIHSRHIISLTMATYEKTYEEKSGSPSASSVEPVEVGHGTTTKKRFPFSLEVRQEESSFAKTKNASNADFDPIPPSKRTWNWGAYVAYWMADAWAVSNWEVGKFLTF